MIQIVTYNESKTRQFLVTLSIHLFIYLFIYLFLLVCFKKILQITNLCTLLKFFLQIMFSNFPKADYS